MSGCVSSNILFPEKLLGNNFVLFISLEHSLLALFIFLPLGSKNAMAVGHFKTFGMQVCFFCQNHPYIRPFCHSMYLFSSGVAPQSMHLFIRDIEHRNGSAQQRHQKVLN